MTIDLYADFADRYDLFFDKFDEHGTDKVNFFKEIFLKNRVSKVLDCACGTGRDLLLFHSLGCEVYGSDLSEAMLKQARVNLQNYKVEIPKLLAVLPLIFNLIKKQIATNL